MSRYEIGDTKCFGGRQGRGGCCQMGSTHQYGIDLSGLRWLSVVSVEVAEAFVNFSEKLAWPISQQAAKA